MKFLFSHRNFPAQFRHIITELGKDPENEIVFLCETPNKYGIKNVRKVLYKLKREVPKDCHRYLRQYEEAIIHGQAAAESLIRLKKSGFTPDVIYAHGWGNSLFFKDIFPDVPLINYCEWYYNSHGADIGFDGKLPDIDKMAMTRCNNSQFLQDLINCDRAICPTNWQKRQFPKIFQDKIEVMHDGIDTEYFVPDDNVKFKLSNSDLTLTNKDEVLTYATRGMEPMRGFPQFMEIASILMEKRPNLHVIIAGEDRVCYGPKLANGTFKEQMLKKFKYDNSRLHFTGRLPYMEYKKLLQVSSVHCYLTYPFVLSWSMLEAMATECLIVASKTPPVEEAMEDNKTGLLVDFYNVKGFVQKIEYALDNQEKLRDIRKNARKIIVDNYDLKKLLPKHIEMIKNTAKHKVQS